MKNKKKEKKNDSFPPSTPPKIEKIRRQKKRKKHITPLQKMGKWKNHEKTNEMKRKKNKHEKTLIIGRRERGARVGHEREEGHEGANISHFFFSHPQFLVFLFSLGVFSLNLGGFFGRGGLKRRGLNMHFLGSVGHLVRQRPQSVSR